MRPKQMLCIQILYNITVKNKKKNVCHLHTYTYSLRDHIPVFIWTKIEANCKLFWGFL